MPPTALHTNAVPRHFENHCDKIKPTTGKIGINGSKWNSLKFLSNTPTNKLKDIKPTSKIRKETGAVSKTTVIKSDSLPSPSTSGSSASTSSKNINQKRSNTPVISDKYRLYTTKKSSTDSPSTSKKIVEQKKQQALKKINVVSKITKIKEPSTSKIEETKCQDDSAKLAQNQTNTKTTDDGIRDDPTSLGNNMTELLHWPTSTIHQHIKDISQPDNGKASSNSSSGYVSLELDFTKEEDRLKTFKSWPNKQLSPEKLAKAGFYSLEVSDIVKCAFCGIEGFKWVAGDDPMADHSKWNPSCSFVRAHGNCRNEHHDNPQSTRGEDTCGKFGIQYFPKSVPEDENASLEKFGVKKTKGPAHTDYISVDSRLKSFADWPKSLKQKPAELAEAGFYYLGTGDQTLCFYCGGGLKDWEDSDDPWEQHALWFPKCNFLVLKKGQEYVDKINNKEVVVPEEKEEIPSSSRNNSSSSLETKEDKKESTPTKEVDIHLCKICYKNELAVVFLPCGHMVACTECATVLRQCAVCRKPVEATVRAFLS